MLRKERDIKEVKESIHLIRPPAASKSEAQLKTTDESLKAKGHTLDIAVPPLSMSSSLPMSHLLVKFFPFEKVNMVMQVPKKRLFIVENDMTISCSFVFNFSRFVFGFHLPQTCRRNRRRSWLKSFRTGTQNRWTRRSDHSMSPPSSTVASLRGRS